jgi:hypothetical protein
LEKVNVGVGVSVEVPVFVDVPVIVGVNDWVGELVTVPVADGVSRNNRGASGWFFLQAMDTDKTAVRTTNIFWAFLKDHSPKKSSDADK